LINVVAKAVGRAVEQVRGHAGMNEIFPSVTGAKVPAKQIRLLIPVDIGSVQSTGGVGGISTFDAGIGALWKNPSDLPLIDARGTLYA
jgi:hypothetical protein